jgi:hypothetical protein
MYEVAETMRNRVFRTYAGQFKMGANFVRCCSIAAEAAHERNTKTPTTFLSR